MSLDVIYLVGPGDPNEELRYSLRSVARNLPHRKIWVVGDKPKWVTGVEFIPGNPKSNKYQNVVANLLAACEADGPTPNVVLMNDDFFVLRSVAAVAPTHLGPATEANKRRAGTYQTGMKQTIDLLRRWGVPEPILSYEGHRPFPINRKLMADALRRAEGEKLVAVQYRTLYGNLYRIGGERGKDVKVSTSTQTWDEGQVFVSTANNTWQNGRVGKRLRVLFSDPSPYEKGV